MTIEEILTGEKDNVEYKVDIPPKSETYMRTVVAYANANGGRLVFGVENNSWKVVGFAKEDVFRKMDNITNAIYDSCEPKITPLVSLQDFDGKYIIIVDIPAGMQRPYCIKSQGMVDGVYIRVSGTTRKAAIYQIQEMVLGARNRRYDQEKVNRELTEKEINELCERLYLHALELCEDDDARAKMKRIGKNQLLSYKLIVEENNRYYATNGYQLLDGKLDDYPDAAIQCAVFKGTSRNVFITRKEFKGSIDEQVESAYSFVLEHIDMGARIFGLIREDIYELPLRTIREIITNAVCHRSYLASGKVQVALFDDRLEVTSPGMLDSDLTIEQMKEGLSRIRNRGIAEIFAYMHMIEGWGSGIPDMFTDAKRYGLPEPSLEDRGSDFRVNLYRRSLDTDLYGVIDPQKNEINGANGAVNKNNGTNPGTIDTILKANSETIGTISEVSADENRLLELIRINENITQKELANETGFSLRKIKRLIAELKKKDRLVRTGNNRSGKWVITG